MSDRHIDLYRKYYAGHRALDLAQRAASRWLPRVEALAAQLGALTVLDYGCGSARGISVSLKLDVRDYDPAVPGCDAQPRPADLVVCVHTLEHLEDDDLAPTLRHLKMLADRAVLLVVSCEPSTKVLPDGSPWHSLVRPYPWWHQVLHDGEGYDPVPTLKDSGKEYAALWLRRSS